MLLLCSTQNIYASDDFISHYEYGEMLYDNPRGVSCSRCHGESGGGKVIVTYKGPDGSNMTIDGPDIRSETFASILNSINAYHKVMPRYYLTRQEAKAIYDYLQKKNSKYLSNKK